MCVQVDRQPPQREQSVNTEQVTLLTKLIMYFDIFRERILTSVHRLLTDLHIYEMIDEAAMYLAQHQVLTVIVIAFAISCGIPILMFIAFAILTVISTFAGFIIIEGTLLTVGSVLLCGFVLAMLIILVTIAATIGIAYLGFIEVYGLLQSSPENSALARFLRRKISVQHDIISSTSRNEHED